VARYLIQIDVNILTGFSATAWPALSS